MTQVIVLNDATYHKHPLSTRPAGGHVIASNIREAGYTCEVIDWFTVLPNFFEILEKLATKETKVLAISATFLAPPTSVGLNEALSDQTGLGVYKDETVDNVSLETEVIYDRNLYLWLDNEETAKNWFSKVRSILPDITIIMGGPRTARIFKIAERKKIKSAIDNIDYFVVGEGDEAAIKIIDKIIKGKGNFLREVDKNGLKFIFSNRYDKPIPPIKHTKFTNAVSGEWMPLEISRGCKFNCSFCNYEKNVYRKKDRQTLIDELTRNYEMFGVKGYHLTCDCLNDSKKYMDIFTDALKSLYFDIEYVSYTRLDMFHKYEDMMEQLFETGFRAGWFGLETFNHDAAKAAKKGLHPDRVKQLMQLLKDKSHKYGGFWLSVYLVFGLPKETIESLEETISWFKNNHVVDEVSVSVLDIAEFSEQLVDMTSFSDHTLNPEKFGFTELSYNPFYWKHETMDVHDAIRMKEKFKEEMKYHTSTRYGGSAMNEYGSIRTLGFSHSQTVKLLKVKLGDVGSKLLDMDKNLKVNVRKQLLQLSQEKLKKYNDSLLSFKQF